MADLAQGVVTIHVLLALATAALVVALAIVALGAAVGRSVSRTVLDRLVLAVILASAVGAISGLGLVLLDRSASDLLHLVYGVATVVILPVARISASRRTPRGTLPTAQALGRWLLAGSIVTGGVLLRLAMTG